MADDGVDATTYRLSESVKNAVEEARQKIISGDIHVPDYTESGYQECLDYGIDPVNIYNPSLKIL